VESLGPLADVSFPARESSFATAQS
jgi:hypothetical protein